MSFVRIRTIKNKQYRYEETRWREGGKVRSRSKCLGPVSGEGSWLRRQFPSTHSVDWDATAREEVVRMNAEAARHATHIARLELELGVNLGPASLVPVEKPPSQVDLNAPASKVDVDAEKEETSPEGEAEVSESPDL